MTSPLHHDDRDMNLDLERYLDGLMEPDEARRYEATIAADPTLRAAVDVQRHVDASLSRLFDPPEQVGRNGTHAGPTPSIGRSETPQVAGRVGRRSVPRWFGGIAAVLAGAIGLWLVWSTVRPQASGYDPGPWHDLTTTYAMVVDDGYEPDWICENDDEFRSAFQSRFAQSLTLGPLPDGSRAVGLAYRNTVSSHTILVLGEVDGQPVIVYVDRVEADHGQPAPDADSGLRLFRSHVGSLALYELTPLDRPVLLEFFHSQGTPSGIVESVEGG